MGGLRSGQTTRIRNLATICLMATRGCAYADPHINHRWEHSRLFSNGKNAVMGIFDIFRRGRPDATAEWVSDSSQTCRFCLDQASLNGVCLGDAFDRFRWLGPAEGRSKGQIRTILRPEASFVAQWIGSFHRPESGLRTAQWQIPERPEPLLRL